MTVLLNKMYFKFILAPYELCVKERINSHKDLKYRMEREFPTNRLLLRDCPIYPLSDNAVDDIRSFIVDRLDLPHLEWNILQATYTDKGLLFEMTSANDVQDILDQFYMKLRNKECVLKRTVKEFYEIEIS